jgi:hypothetical protein
MNQNEYKNVKRLQTYITVLRNVRRGIIKELEGEVGKELLHERP